MDPSLAPQLLAGALAEPWSGAASPRQLPTPPELQQLLAEAETALVLGRGQSTGRLIVTGWYLHAVASASNAAQIYTIERQRQAFAVSAHIFDLAAADDSRPWEERSALVFAGQVGYHRSD